MNTVIVLYNLKPGTSPEEYERWAREQDLPTVNGLASVDAFEVLRSRGLLIGEGKPPYEYVEVMRVPWDYDLSNEKIDGVMISNGPGDPKQCTKTIFQIRRLLQRSLRLGGLGPRLRWILRDARAVLVPNDAAFPYADFTRWLRGRRTPYLLVQEGIRFPLPGERGGDT